MTMKVELEANGGSSVPGEGEEEGEEEGEGEGGSKRQILYTVSEVPPWYQCILLGFQQFLTAFGATFTFPLLMTVPFCIMSDNVGMSELISTVIFVAGFSTLIQTFFGVRLPIIQSVSYSFIAPITTLMNLEQWKCPYGLESVNQTTLPEIGSEEHRSSWHLRISEVQGAIMIAALFQIAIGFSGLMGLMLKFIGPLTITPTIAMIGLSLYDAASDKASVHWWIALTTVALIALFSQYLRKVNVPCLTFSQGKCSKTKLPLFNMFPVLMAVGLSWILCYVLTVTDVLPSDDTKWGHGARTDIRQDVLDNAEWFRFPYPGQWGMPTVSIAGVFGMLAGNLASMVESVGDYYACARLSGAPPPPGSAVSRGIGFEGITCLLAGAWGTGAGTTSYSENIGAIGITKVGSRVVVQTGALIMLLLGCLGKFGALFVTLPDPIVGGMFFVMFGMVAAVGISNLQFVDLGSIRNLFVLGLSIISGFSIPRWVGANQASIYTGSDVLDQILTVLCGTSMFVAGALAFFLDNTIPGTDEERGIIAWRDRGSSFAGGSCETERVYDLPFIQKFLDRMSWPRYLPFCPHFVLDDSDASISQVCCRRSASREVTGAENMSYSQSDTRL